MKQSLENKSDAMAYEESSKLKYFPLVQLSTFSESLCIYFCAANYFAEYNSNNRKTVEPN